MVFQSLLKVSRILRKRRQRKRFCGRSGTLSMITEEVERSGSPLKWGECQADPKSYFILMCISSINKEKSILKQLQFGLHHLIVFLVNVVGIFLQKSCFLFLHLQSTFHSFSLHLQSDSFVPSTNVGVEDAAPFSLVYVLWMGEIVCVVWPFCVGRYLGLGTISALG